MVFFYLFSIIIIGYKNLIYRLMIILKKFFNFEICIRVYYSIVYVYIISFEEIKTMSYVGKL